MFVRERSVFVDASGDDAVWATEMALRNAGVCVVIADARGWRIAASRRLAVAASSGRAVGLLLRHKARDHSVPSAAQTRWRVESAMDGGAGEWEGIAWMVELMRCKGVQPVGGDARRFVAQRDDATGEINNWTPCSLGVVSDAVGRSAREAPARATA
jgi:hypothetical protein